ncbi:MAG: nucleotidyltransferase family protein [Oscillospiraceae bacterium]|nr:nucleotidyltransferase family protein [Ruminococcus sp.]MBQ4346320.1 nucleotidyltransferase family protein [Oscillospiraceae bacterium]
MKISGIICEYNPFHNGHLHHIRETRKNGATHIVAVMSGNFVQRGDVAIMDKFTRAKTAVTCGADLVLELPVPYALGAAEVFARGAVSLLDNLCCVSELSFGSECGDIPLLQKAMEASAECADKPELEELLRLGNSYPKALRILIRQNYGDAVSALFDTPNNVLAIEYLRAIDKLQASMQPFTVRRLVPHDAATITDDQTSASHVRRMLLDGKQDYEKLIPAATAQSIRSCAASGNIARFINLERVLLYRLRTATPEELLASPEVAHGLENKILAARNETSLDAMFAAIKSKRYTLSRLRRIMLHILLGIRKEHIATAPPYARILALNERGSEILTAAKQAGSKLPCSTSPAKLAELNDISCTIAELEAQATAVYGLALGKIAPADADYRAKIAISKG